MIMEIISLGHFLTFLSTFLFTLLAYLYWDKLIGIGLDATSGIQKIHFNKSYRIGGCIIVFFTSIIGLLSGLLSSEYLVLIICLGPIFLAGFIEDIFRKASVSSRLAASLVSAILIVFFTNTKLSYINVNFIDFILSYEIFAIVITALGIAITANAWNFIDGLNGVSAGLAVIVLIVLIVLSNKENLDQLTSFLSLFSVSIFGFWLINQFCGKIFLGDAGSYFIGSIIGWSGVKITSEAANISPWVIFFVIIYPATEFSVSFFRRLISKSNPTIADNKHLHSLLFKFLCIKFNKKTISFNNSISGIIILLFTSIPSLYIIFFNETVNTVYFGLIIFLFFYFCSYFFILNRLKMEIL